jgi:CHAD domain-containing protein
VSSIEVPRSAIGGALASSAERLLSWAPGVDEASGAEDVHHARTAIRRLRADLRSFRPAMLRRPVRSLRSELRWVGGILSRVRELDVLLEQIERAVAGLPEDLAADARRVSDRLHSERRTAWAVALGHLSGARSRQLRAELEGLATSPPFRARVRVTSADLMRPAWRRLRRAAKAAAAHPSEQALHRVRIAAKRVRYAAEALEPVVGARATRFARKAADLQDALGARRDAVVAVELLAEPAATMDARGAYAAGILAAMCAAERDRAAADIPRAWRRLAKRKRRFW